MGERNPEMRRLRQGTLILRNDAMQGSYPPGGSWPAKPSILPLKQHLIPLLPPEWESTLEQIGNICQ